MESLMKVFTRGFFVYVLVITVFVSNVEARKVFINKPIGNDTQDQELSFEEIDPTVVAAMKANNPCRLRLKGAFPDCSRF